MSRLARVAGITEKEWPRAQSMALLCFALMMALAFGRATRDAFFIKNAGAENLPIVYVINGILIAACAAIYSRIVHKLSLTRFMGVLCIFFAAWIVFFRAWIQTGFAQKAIPYAVWSLAELYNILMMMHFWTLASTVFDPREGKRMFPLIGGVGLTGMIVGGLLTSFLVNFIQSTNLLFVWALLIALSVPFVRVVATRTRQSGIHLHAGRHREDSESILEEWKQIWQIPLMRTLTYIAFPMWITAWLVDFQFFKTLDSIYPEQEGLAGALGVFNGATSFIGLLLQFFVTGKLLQTIGIGGAAILYPTAMMISAIGLSARGFISSASNRIFEPRNLLGVSPKFTDVTLFGSVHDSTLALLFNSLPDETRPRARAFLNGAMEPIATALAGLMLLAMARFNLPGSTLAAVTLGISLIWLLFALRVKKHYFAALVSNLNSRNFDQQRNAYSVLSTNKDAETRELLIAAVSSMDEEMALFAIGLLDAPDSATVDRLTVILPHATPRLKLSLLNFLGKAGYKESIEPIRHELYSPEADVRAAAIHALGEIGEDPRFIAKFLKDHSATVAAEAIVIHLKGSTLQKAALARLDKLSNSKDNDHLFHAARVLRAVPLQSRITSLLHILKNGNEISRNEAIRALGQIGNKKALQILAASLTEDDIYLSCKESLLAVGKPALAALHQELNRQMDADAKLSIISCLGEIGSIESIPQLAKLIVRQPVLVENAAAEALTNIRMKFLMDTGTDVADADQHFSTEIRARIKHSYESIVDNLQKDRIHVRALSMHKQDFRVALILDAADRFSRQRLESALKFLELIADPRTIRSIAGDLKSTDGRSRAEAIEALEGSCPEAVQLVRALESDDMTVASPKTPLDEILRTILWKNHPPWITSCAIHAIGEFNLVSLEPELFSFLDHEDPMVSLNARSSLKKLKSKTYRTLLARERAKVKLEKETKAMDIRMERFLFLRSVPLFADVDGSDLHWINEITHEQTFRPRNVIFREGDPGESLYIIISGSVRVFKGQKKKEITIDILQERDCFGEMAILDQEPRSASVIAVRPSRLLVIHRADFQRLLIARPRISFGLFKTISRRVREANARFFQTVKQDAVAAKSE